MKEILSLFLLLFVASSFALAQKGDGCHVYVIDFELAQKAGPMGCSKDKDESRCGVTAFPDFKPDIGEEVSTSKSYKFPGLDQMITANVFFTDEMLASSKSGDSIMMSVTVAPKILEGAFSDENSAVAEFTLKAADAMRVKRIFKFDGRRYFVGLECHFKKVSF